MASAFARTRGGEAAQRGGRGARREKERASERARGCAGAGEDCCAARERAAGEKALSAARHCDARRLGPRWRPARSARRRRRVRWWTSWPARRAESPSCSPATRSTRSRCELLWRRGARRPQAARAATRCAGSWSAREPNRERALQVRLQTQPQDKPLYTGLVDCLRKTLKNEGVGGLYKGVASPLAGQAVFNAWQFMLYGQVRRSGAGRPRGRAAPLSPHPILTRAPAGAADHQGPRRRRRAAAHHPAVLPGGADRGRGRGVRREPAGPLQVTAAGAGVQGETGLQHAERVRQAHLARGRRAWRVPRPQRHHRPKHAFR
jgi:hypothetical protein